MGTPRSHPGARAGPATRAVTSQGRRLQTVLLSFPVPGRTPRWMVASLTAMWLVAIAAGIGLVVADVLPHAWPGGCGNGLDGDPLAAWFGLIMACAGAVTLVALRVRNGNASSSPGSDPRPVGVPGRSRFVRFGTAAIPAVAFAIAIGGFWMFMVGNTSALVICRHG